jgi:transposase
MHRIRTEAHCELTEFERHIAAMNQEIEAIAAGSDTGRRLMTVPGIGPLLAAAGSVHQSSKARDIAAWVALVPREYSTGRKTKMLGIS